MSDSEVICKQFSDEVSAEMKAIVVRALARDDPFDDVVDRTHSG